MDFSAPDGGFPTGTLVRVTGGYRDPHGYGLQLEAGELFPGRVGHGGGHTRWYKI